jgi:hypothetical protein
MDLCRQDHHHCSPIEIDGRNQYLLRAVDREGGVTEGGVTEGGVAGSSPPA